VNRAVTALDYSHYQDFLEQAGFPGGAADVHGALCGMLSGGGIALTELWLEDILADCEPGDAEQAVLRESLVGLGLNTWRELAGTELEFAPLLPDDGVSLEIRAEALAGWCQGFLFGLARAGLVEAQLKQGVIGEALPDFVEISKATGEGDQDSADEGFALEELIEYVRVTAQLVFEELLPIHETPSQLH
jgi:uncharacterized protein YgfB (UPF0149 family)